MIQELTRAVYDAASGSDKSVHMLGIDFDPILIERANILLEQPVPADGRNCIEFQSVDVMDTSGQRDQIWRQYLQKTTGRERFDFIFCFSTTMWIHLNYGDQGLDDLLATLSTWAENVVVEPQPWKCYRNAARRLKRAGQEPFPLYDGLRYREKILERIEQVLSVQRRMTLHSHLGQSKWDRPVWWFQHTAAPAPEVS